MTVSELQLMKETIEENQSRKILIMVEDTKKKGGDIDDAIETMRAMLNM